MVRTIILSNKAQCKACGSIVVAPGGAGVAHCKCGRILIGGGTSALVRAGDVNLIEELSETYNEDVPTRPTSDCGCGAKSN